MVIRCNVVPEEQLAYCHKLALQSTNGMHRNPLLTLQVVDRSSAAHERHDFGDAGRLLYDFCWGEFADWYIEAAKARLYGQDPAAALQTRQVNHTLCLNICNILATPIVMVQSVRTIS